VPDGVMKGGAHVGFAEADVGAVGLVGLMEFDVIALWQERR